MNIPDDVMYTREHEWVRIEGDEVTVGITDYAQEQLGDIVYVELPTVGDSVARESTFGVLESVKAVSDCFAPISGEVTEANGMLDDHPETVNTDPYGEGWIIKVNLSEKTELEDLLTPEQYEAFVNEVTA